MLTKPVTVPTSFVVVAEAAAAPGAELVEVDLPGAVRVHLRHGLPQLRRAHPAAHPRRELGDLLRLSRTEPRAHPWAPCAALSHRTHRTRGGCRLVK